VLYDHVLLVSTGSLCTLSSTGDSGTGTGAFTLLISHVTTVVHSGPNMYMLVS
jgi:hypothetical protein